MIKSVIGGIGLSIGMIIFQLTVLPAVGLGQYLNVFLVVMIIATLTLGVSQTIWWSVAAATVLDFYSLLPFGLTVSSYVFTIILIDIIARQWVTNRATFTIGMLIIGATICQLALMLIGAYLMYWLNISNLTIPITGRTLMLIGIQVVSNCVLAVILASVTRSTRLATGSVEQHI